MEHPDNILIVDFGSQVTQLIARRVREAHVYSEIVPHTITAAEVRERRPAALILSGGPKSVHVEGAPLLDPEIFDLGVPILGICYGAQLIAQQLVGGTGGIAETAMHAGAQNAFGFPAVIGGQDCLWDACLHDSMPVVAGCRRLPVRVQAAAIEDAGRIHGRLDALLQRRQRRRQLMEYGARGVASSEQRRMAAGPRRC